MKYLCVLKNKWNNLTTVAIFRESDFRQSGRHTYFYHTPTIPFECYTKCFIYCLFKETVFKKKKKVCSRQPVLHAMRKEEF